MTYLHLSLQLDDEDNERECTSGTRYMGVDTTMKVSNGT